MSLCCSLAPPMASRGASGCSADHTARWTGWRYPDAGQRARSAVWHRPWLVVVRIGRPATHTVSSGLSPSLPWTGQAQGSELVLQPGTLPCLLWREMGALQTTWPPQAVSQLALDLSGDEM